MARANTGEQELYAQPEPNRSETLEGLEQVLYDFYRVSSSWDIDQQSQTISTGMKRGRLFLNS